MGCLSEVGGEEGGECLGVGWGGEEEVRGGEFAEGLGEWEGLVEEEVEGDDSGAGVLGGAGGEVAVGGLEDEGWELGVLGAEADGEGGSEAGAVEDDVGGGDGTGGSEVGEGGGGVGFHGGLGGVLAEGLAVAAVVEEEDVEVLGVEELGGGERVGEGAVGAIEYEGGAGGGG